MAKKKNHQAAQPIDREWFEHHLKGAGYRSQNELARKLGIHASALSRIWKGEQALSLKHAHEIARLLNVDPNEVARRVGVRVYHAASTLPIPVMGTVSESGQVQTLDRPMDHVQAPGDMPEQGSIALLIEQGMMAGWLLFTTTSQPEIGDIAGRLCITSADDEDPPQVSFVQRSLHRGQFDLIAPWSADNAQTRHSVTLRWATPVLWIRPI